MSRCRSVTNHITASGCEETCWNGGTAVSISITVQPKLQISACHPCPVRVTTSGAIQFGVPFGEVKGLSPLLRIPTDPKSASLHTLSAPMRMLAPLMSRWTSPLLCR